MNLEQIQDNILNGKSCPDCGDYEVSATDIKEQWGCRACGYMGDESEFIAPEIEAHPSDRCHLCLLDCRVAFPACEATLEQYLTDEANWPAMNRITRALWQQMTSEMRARQMTSPIQECFDPRADGRVENDF